MKSFLIKVDFIKTTLRDINLKYNKKPFKDLLIE